MLIDFKRAVLAGVRMAEAVYMPEYTYRYIRLLLCAVAMLQGEQLPGEPESYIVYILHINKAYDRELDENVIVRQVRVGYERSPKKPLTEEKIKESLEFLYRLKVVSRRWNCYKLKRNVYGRLRS